MSDSPKDSPKESFDSDVDSGLAMGSPGRKRVVSSIELV